MITTRFALAIGASGALLCAACSADPAPPSAAFTTQEVRGADGSRKLMRFRNGSLHGRSIVFYPKGGVAALLYFDDGALTGTQRWFYPDGTVKEIQETRAGTVDGKWHKFYATGGAQSIRRVHHNQRTGPYIEFYEHPKNAVKLRAQFVSVAGKEWDNGYLAYDTTGRVSGGRHFLALHASADTLALGDTLTLRFSVVKPQTRQALARVGGYNSRLQLVRPQEERAVLGRANRVVVQVPLMRPGADTIRGYVAEYSDIKVPGRRAQIKERPLYFVYPYFVR